MAYRNWAQHHVTRGNWDKINLCGFENRISSDVEIKIFKNQFLCDTIYEIFKNSP